MKVEWNDGPSTTLRVTNGIVEYWPFVFATIDEYREVVDYLFITLLVWLEEVS